jgi:hypothetical protein
VAQVDHLIRDVLSNAQRIRRLPTLHAAAGTKACAAEAVTYHAVRDIRST